MVVCGWTDRGTRGERHALEAKQLLPLNRDGVAERGAQRVRLGHRESQHDLGAGDLPNVADRD